MEDRELVTLFLRTRDEHCFRLLFRRHTPVLLLLAQRFLGGAAGDAEDVVQEVWIRAVRVMPDFRWQSTLRTWLCGIAINCCREMRRRHHIEISGTEDVAGVMARPVGAGDLEELLRNLPAGYREILLLHDVQGYTHEEIARQLGIAEGTSKSQLSRARATLRRWLDATPTAP